MNAPKRVKILHLFDWKSQKTGGKNTHLSDIRTIKRQVSAGITSSLCQKTGPGIMPHAEADCEGGLPEHNVHHHSQGPDITGRGVSRCRHHLRPVIWRHGASNLSQSEKTQKSLRVCVQLKECVCSVVINWEWWTLKRASIPPKIDPKERTEAPKELKTVSTYATNSGVPHCVNIISVFLLKQNIKKDLETKCQNKEANSTRFCWNHRNEQGKTHLSQHCKASTALSVIV